MNNELLEGMGNMGQEKVIALMGPLWNNKRTKEHSTPLKNTAPHSSEQNGGTSAGGGMPGATANWSQVHVEEQAA